MKTKLPIGLLALSLAVVTGFSSCTQDNELKPVEKEKTLQIIDARTWSQTHVEDLGNGDEGSSADESGNIQFVVKPEDANAVVRIYNDEYDSGDVTVDPDAMIFRYLTPGLYTIDITPGNPAYGPARIENVEVLVNSLTDLGEIHL